MNFILKLPRAVKGILFHLIQWTWCLPQNLAGALVALVLTGKHFRYHGALVTVYRKRKFLSNRAGFSLGSFIFMPEAWSEYQRSHIVVHEYGHTVQSLMLGPLYIFVVGIPSMIWANRYDKHYQRYKERGIDYCDRFPENSADSLGERVTGDKVA